MKNEPLFELDIEKMEEDIKRVQKALDKAEDIALKAAADEMAGIIMDLLGEGMRKAPKDTGYLRGSGIAKLNDDQVAHTESSGSNAAEVVRDFKAGNISLQQFIDELIGEVAFNTPYATYQHEEQDLNHLDGEAKYLETPLKEKSPEYIKGLAAAIEAALDKEGGVR
ncbi:MAG: hypothetical protein BHK79_09015 [Halanaerobium sp. MDAL1]|jgi:hypothetical protein|nr:MAG: hypothetical protein BHK79_09015 [Halanaerobium sp. MDAL1]